MVERRGRRGIFTGKRTARLQGVITEVDSRRFEAARKRLGKAAGVPPEKVSDANTIEYLTRVETVAKDQRVLVLMEIAEIVASRAET